MTRHYRTTPDSAAQRYVFSLDDPCEGGRELLGGKGAGLAEMKQLGIPVPDAFTITTNACRAYRAAGGELPVGMEEELEDHLAALEERTGKRFGDSRDPLLVSVRSGAAVSMPGMMDTILNLGLNDAAVRGLAESTGNPRFAYDSYRRLIQMYGEVVEGIAAHHFETELARRDDDLGALVDAFKLVFEQHAGLAFPQDPRDQLLRAVRAVFDSWDTPRARVYRTLHGIPDDLGTAVNVVQMVFGNKGVSSGTGVAFTRDPSTGARCAYGEFLLDAQGEDVVAGIRTPEPLASLAVHLPAVHGDLLETMRQLELHYRDVQDIEFTIEEERLYLLQTRAAKRTVVAALKTAVDMVEEGLISRAEAVARVDPAQLDQLLHPMIDPEAEVEPAATGLNASPGAASGRIVLDADDAEERGKRGEAVILVRTETTPDDIHGLVHARGVLTALGGMTSHAAVVARGMGKPCVTACTALSIDLDAKLATIGGYRLREGDAITIDGSTGGVIVGEAPLIAPRSNEDLETVLTWADELRRLRVRANADTPEDARKARELGAEGIGLCRTEHMFMAEERLPVMREMILADNEQERREALERLLPMQQADFEAILEAMTGYPVTIRLLDPPLHEFLPPLDDVADPRTRERILQLEERNPMLGLRGCRLGLLHPEIYEMQVRAIVRAARAVRERTGASPAVEVMHPLIGFGEELRRLRELTLRVAVEEGEQECRVGTMIELPRACVCADEIAAYADFCSFGTNDLTQTTLGFSRDDAEEKFLTHYLEDGVVERNPFETLDQAGVGTLMRTAVGLGRQVQPGLKLGICGEHGGDPSSVAFCHELGLDYVSCSPYRVPLARLAAAQAALADVGVVAAVAGARS